MRDEVGQIGSQTDRFLQREIARDARIKPGSVAPVDGQQRDLWCETV